MKHAVIAAHPDPDSFTLSIARTYCEAATAKGHTASLRDLYAMDFDPLLKASEIAGRKGFAPGDDVKAERAALGIGDPLVATVVVGAFALAMLLGAAWVAGHAIVREAEQLKDDIGYMSQRFGLYPDLSVAENIDFYADIYGVPGRGRKERYAQSR